MKRYCLALDLRDDAALIAEYERRHREFNREIRESILNSGILNMEIYRTSNRLFMIMETDEGFTFEQKNKMDADNPRVQEWEELMWTFQQPLPHTKPGEKWVVMEKIFQL